MSPSTGSAADPLGLRLAGRAAGDWFAAHGLLLDRPAGVRMFVDEIGGEGLRLRRLWHTEARLRWVRRAGPTVIALPIDAGLRIEAPDGSTAIAESEALVVPPGAELDLVGVTPTARYEIELDQPLPGALRGHARHVVPSPASHSVLLSAATAAIGAGVDVEGAGFASFRSAVAQLTIGLLLSTRDGSPARISPRAAELFDAARSVILARAADPGFSIRQLAAELHLSPDYVFRVFRVHGTTPAREIRAARLALARSHAGVDGARRRSTWMEDSE